MQRLSLSLLLVKLWIYWKVIRQIFSTSHFDTCRALLRSLCVIARDLSASSQKKTKLRKKTSGSTWISCVHTVENWSIFHAWNKLPTFNCQHTPVTTKQLISNCHLLISFTIYTFFFWCKRGEKAEHKNVHECWKAGTVCIARMSIGKRFAFLSVLLSDLISFQLLRCQLQIAS